MGEKNCDAIISGHKISKTNKYELGTDDKINKNFNKKSNTT